MENTRLDLAFTANDASRCQFNDISRYLPITGKTVRLVVERRNAWRRGGARREERELLDRFSSLPIRVGTRHLKRLMRGGEARGF